MLKFKVSKRLYPLMMLWAVLQSSLFIVVYTKASKWALTWLTQYTHNCSSIYAYIFQVVSYLVFLNKIVHTSLNSQTGMQYA
jgi:hypothetical protein